MSIPKSSGTTSTTPYWKNNMGIRMAMHSYNTKLNAYRRHTSPANLEQVHTVFKEYTKLCTHVRNLSWNQWLTKCNNNINSAEVWRKNKAAHKQHQDPLHTLDHRKRQTHYVTPLLNDTHQKTYQNALTTY